MTLHLPCCGRPKKNVDLGLLKFLCSVVCLWDAECVFLINLCSAEVLEDAPTPVSQKHRDQA